MVLLVGTQYDSDCREKSTPQKRLAFDPTGLRISPDEQRI
jgi:hypothetical protein